MVFSNQIFPSGGHYRQPKCTGRASASSFNPQSTIMSKLVTKARISDKGLAVELSVNAICRLLKVDSPTTEQLYMVNIAARLTRTGVAMKLVQHNGNAPVKGAAVNTLLKTIGRGHALWQQLRDDGITVGVNWQSARGDDLILLNPCPPTCVP